MTVMMIVCDCMCVCFSACVCVCVFTAKTKTASYHAVHSEVVVLCLQLDSMLVVPSNLCVTGEEKSFVVHDPIKHLHNNDVEKMQLVL